MAQHFVANWFPRRPVDMLPAGRGRPPGGSQWSAALSAEAKRHRELTIGVNEDGVLTQVPKYPTVQDSNAAMAQQRRTMVDALTNPTQALSKALGGLLEARQIHKLAASDQAEARKQAASFAHRLAPDFETDFFKVLQDGAYRRQAAAITSHRALEMWKETLAQVRDPLTQAPKAERAVVQPKSARESVYFKGLGYQYTQHPLFGQYLFHSDLAKLIDRASPALKDSLTGRGMAAAAEVERLAVKSIMYSAAVHAPNVLGRVGMWSFSHPIDFVSHLIHQSKLTPELARQEQQAWRLKMMNSGFVAHRADAGTSRNVQGIMSDVFGDTFGNDLEAAPEQSRFQKLAESIGASAPGKAYGATVGWVQRWSQDQLWSRTNDFGLMAARLEYEAMTRQGISEEEASLRAARRGMSWSGMVAPEDKNPLWHDAGRIMFFAPNWWRTLGELMVPLYRHSGVPLSPQLVKHVAWNQAKTMAGMLVFQHASGNALNFIMSGHAQYQNEPGEQDKVEVSRPEMIRFLQELRYPGADKIDPKTGTDPKTGGRLYLENPLARQTYDLEKAAGFQSTYLDPKTHSDAWTPHNVQEGSASVLAARLSPFLSAMSSMGNVDLYQSVKDGEVRHVDPYQKGWSPMDLLYGAAYMTPLGINLSQNLAHAQTQPGAADTVPGPFGTKVPRSMNDSLNAVKDAVTQTGLSWLTGVNAPYEVSNRTRGQSPSDQQYVQLNQAEQTYHTQMSQLSSEALAGQITPDEWRTRYHDLSQQHSGELNGIFRGAPEYANGAQGMAAQWEDLYNQATLPDGSIDYAKLSELQGAFQHQHAPGDLTAMQTYLKQSQQKYPMVNLYHDTVQGYRTWQEQWAAGQGLDVTRLQQEIHEYGQVYSDSRARGTYLHQHPDLVAYEKAKKTEFDRSPTGLLYAMFYGGNSQVARAMRYSGLAQQDFLAQLAAQQQQDPTAQAGPAAREARTPAPAPAAPAQQQPVPVA
jgi:hypothetical protein